MNKRRDPFEGMDEPVQALGLAETFPAALRAGNRRRKYPRTPSEERRTARRIGVTFSDESIPERLRALAERWGWIAPDGRSPNVSAVVEFLLLPQLRRAESGETPEALENI